MTDQAQAVYAAEDLWENREPRARIKFGDWNEVWPFYWTLVEKCREAGIADLKVPKVKPRKGALKAHYDSATATVFIPPYSKGGAWALNTGTALHEFAHHMTPGAGHGPAFREAMVNLLGAIGWDPEVLAECYEQVGLTTSEKGDGMTDKVGKLLTHADKAATDEERRTYIEKAANLAAIHAINLALVRKRQADAEGGVRDRPITSDFYALTALPNVTYRNLAVELGSAICQAHGARCTIRGKSQWLTFYGYSEDVHLTELMLARITPMMFEEADRYLKSPEHKESGAAAVSARIDFCKNFAYEVGNRLREAVKQAEKATVEAQALEGGEEAVASTELAIREKAIEVADYVEHEFKRMGVKGSWHGSSTNSWTGGASSAGRTAAQNANLFGRKELG